MWSKILTSYGLRLKYVEQDTYIIWVEIKVCGARYKCTYIIWVEIKVCGVRYSQHMG